MFTAKVFWRRDSVLKSGTVQFRPTSRSRLSTNPVVCRSAMPNSTLPPSRALLRNTLSGSGQADLNGRIAVGLLAATPACRHGIPAHLGIGPIFYDISCRNALPVRGSSASPGALALRYRLASSWSSMLGPWVCSYRSATTLVSRDDSLTRFVQQSLPIPAPPPAAPAAALAAYRATGADLPQVEASRDLAPLRQVVARFQEPLL